MSEQEESIRGMRQDLDGLMEQVSLLIETLEVRHAEVSEKLDVLEAKLDESVEGLYEAIGEVQSSPSEISQKDVAEIKEMIVETNQEVATISEAVQNIDEELQQS